MSDTLTNEAENVQEVVSDTSSPYLETLVGEGKKYKTPEDLAKAYFNADKHIHELREDLDTIKQDREAFHEVINELRKEPKKPEQVVTPTPKPVTPNVSEDDFAKQVERTLNDREARKTFQDNTEATLNKLSEVYGSRDNGLLAVKKIISTNPAMREILDKMGGTDPDATVAFVTSRVPKEGPMPNTPGIGNGNQGTHVIETPRGVVTWSQARDLRKKDPKRYNSLEFKKVLEASYAHFQTINKDFFTT